MPTIIARLSETNDFESDFKSDTACEDLLIDALTKGDNLCPFCDGFSEEEYIKGVTPFYFFSKKGRIRCAKCSKDFTFKTHTIFHASKISIRKWLKFIHIQIHQPDKNYLVASKEIGVTPQAFNLMKRKYNEYVLLRSNNTNTIL